MNYSETIKFLYKRFNRGYNNASYYTNIGQWLDWYKGTVKDFHSVRVSNGLTSSTHEIYKLKMAKRVCEDYTSAILSKDISFVINSNNKRSDVFVQGTKGNGGVLGSNDFENLLSTALEKMFALGTSAFVVELNNIQVDNIGNILTSPNAKINITQKDATCILPISWVNGIINEAAFLGEITIKEKVYTIVTSHIKEEDGYVIYTDIIDNKGVSQPLPLGYVPIIRTHIEKPLFEILKTNIANNIDLNSPLGLSVYANAIDVLKGCDEVYDSILGDIKAKQPITFMNKNLLARDTEGNVAIPQDYKQRFMQYFGDDVVSENGAENFIKNFSPALNTDALDKELQNQLNLLSSKVGLGQDYYKFDNGTIKTATEYLGDKADFVANSDKITKGLLNALKGLVRTILVIGHDVMGLNVDVDAKIDILYNDGVDEDDSKQREQDRQDVKDGIMSKAEYRAKWYGETIQEAEKKIAQIENNSSVNSTDSNIE